MLKDLLLRKLTFARLPTFGCTMTSSNRYNARIEAVIELTNACDALIPRILVPVVMKHMRELLL